MSPCSVVLRGQLCLQRGGQGLQGAVRSLGRHGDAVQDRAEVEAHYEVANRTNCAHPNIMKIRKIGRNTQEHAKYVIQLENTKEQEKSSP